MYISHNIIYLYDMYGPSLSSTQMDFSIGVTVLDHTHYTHSKMVKLNNCSYMESDTESL